jgi:hypothetical protein
MNGPVWPDAQPWDSYLFTAAAVVIVLLNRKTMFTRAGAATDVVPPPRGTRGRSLPEKGDVGIFL